MWALTTSTEPHKGTNGKEERRKEKAKCLKALFSHNPILCVWKGARRGKVVTRGWVKGKWQNGLSLVAPAFVTAA